MAELTSQQVLAQALSRVLVASDADTNPDPDNIVDAVVSLGKSIRFGAQHLGNGDAATPMGAMEALGEMLYKSADRIAVAIETLAEALQDQV